MLYSATAFSWKKGSYLGISIIEKPGGGQRARGRSDSELDCSLFRRELGVIVSSGEASELPAPAHVSFKEDKP